MKRVLMLTIVTLFLLGTAFSAFCAGEQEGTGETGKTKQASIHVALQKHPATDALKQLLPEFEDASGIDVELEDIPQDQLNAKVELALASESEEYDVVMLGHMLVPQYQRPGWIVSLSDFIEDPTMTDPDSFRYNDILQGFVNAASVDGELYAMPFYGESTMLMYNKEMFEEAGLDGPPQTMDELEMYAQKLTKKDQNQYGIAMRGRRGINWYPWSGFCYGFGGSWLDENGKPALTQPEVIEATEFFAKLISEYGPPGAANFTWNDVQVSMQQGTSAMIIDATNFGPRLEDPEESTVVGKVGYAMVPKGPAGRYPSVYSAAIAIPSFSKEKEAAWEFIKWATSAEVQVETALLVNRLDLTRESAWNDDRYREKYDYPEMIEVTIKALDEAIAEYLPRIPEFGDLADTLGIAINKVIVGETSAEKAMQQAMAELEPVFE